jgi:hypothetical protein
VTCVYLLRAHLCGSQSVDALSSRAAYTLEEKNTNSLRSVLVDQGFLRCWNMRRFVMVVLTSIARFSLFQEYFAFGENEGRQSLDRLDKNGYDISRLDNRQYGAFV